MMKRGNRHKKGLALLLVVMTTLTVALSGCSGDKAEDSSKITIGIPQDIDSLDPHKAEGAGTREVLFNVFEGLVKPDENGNLNPAVASDYTISDDGKTYTFTLRDGIKFHNGNPVTVEDIKYSIDRSKPVSGMPKMPVQTVSSGSITGAASTRLAAARLPNGNLKRQDSPRFFWTVMAVTAVMAEKARLPQGSVPFWKCWKPEETEHE